MNIEIAILIIALAYLMGSIPSGLLIAKMANRIDIRALGSGNIGATNVARVIGKKFGIFTLLADFFKCFIIPIFLCFLLEGAHLKDTLVFFCFIYAILGHLFPLWLKFKGGKGVACFFAFIFFANWVIGILCAITWIVVFKLFRYSSLSSLSAIMVFLVFAVAFFEFRFLIPIFLISMIIVLKHAPNIHRMFLGIENKF